MCVTCQARDARNCRLCLPCECSQAALMYYLIPFCEAWPAWTSGACLGLIVQGHSSHREVLVIILLSVAWGPSLFSVVSTANSREMCFPRITISNYFCSLTLTPFYFFIFLCFFYTPVLFSHFLATSSLFFCPRWCSSGYYSYCYNGK